MRTVIENLQGFADEVKASLVHLVQEHSSIRRWNDRGSGIITMSGDYAWEPLRPEGKRLQSKVLGQYRHFYALLRTLLQDQPQEDLGELEESNNVLLQVIEQNSSTWKADKADELKQATSALDTLLKLMHNLYAPAETGVIIVPDTNALLYNAYLENWAFDEISSFTIALTPTVLSELDSIKVNHRNEDVRKKAERLIRQIKEYRRRGRLSHGVPLKRRTSTIKSFAREPIMESSLPWLQPNNNDDRLLASVLEIMRQHVQSVVFLVSRDINVQNKAEFAELPFLEPPENV